MTASAEKSQRAKAEAAKAQHSEAVEETPEVAEGAYPDLTKEKKAAQTAALKHEKAGYEARIEQLKSVGDSEAVKVIEGRVKQVETELKKLSKASASEPKVDEEEA